MTDTSEIYEALRQHPQEKRAENREASAEFLRRFDVPFTVHNNGAHLIVEVRTGYVDFWPGTGRWIARDGKRGFGVRNLIGYIMGEVRDDT